MIMRMSPYIFQVCLIPSHLNVERADTLNQCGAAIYQLCPNSALFKLPALANKDIQTWMRTTFQTELVALQAAAGCSVDLAQLQNEILQ